MSAPRPGDLLLAPFSELQTVACLSHLDGERTGPWALTHLAAFPWKPPAIVGCEQTDNTEGRPSAVLFPTSEDLVPPIREQKTEERKPRTLAIPIRPARHHVPLRAASIIWARIAGASTCRKHLCRRDQSVIPMPLLGTSQQSSSHHKFTTCLCEYQRETALGLVETHTRRSRCR
jgi:hypothetical protein